MLLGLGILERVEADFSTEDSAGFMVCGEEDYEDEDEDDEVRSEQRATPSPSRGSALSAAARTTKDLPHPNHQQAAASSRNRRNRTGVPSSQYTYGARRMSQPLLYTQTTVTSPSLSYRAFRRSSEGNNFYVARLI